MTEKNVVLLMATMATIKMHPEKHDQGTWVDPCNTTMCFAGHAAVISGATFDKDIFESEDGWLIDPNGKHVSEYDAIDENCHLKDGYLYINEYAREKLGLNYQESSYLFNHSRTPWELEEAIAKFSNGYTVDYNGRFVKEES